eukprot:4897397-Pyramimonas_sp.AAC.1
MEHPAPRPVDPTIPSSWYLPELVALARAEGVHTVDTDQCHLTAPPSNPLAFSRFIALLSVGWWTASRGGE